MARATGSNSLRACVRKAIRAGPSAYARSTVTNSVTARSHTTGSASAGSLEMKVIRFCAGA